MPKTLVLLLSDDPALAARARQVADGARRVRFAEVDVRRAGDPAGLRTAADYDALVLGVAAGAGAADADAALRTFAGTHPLADTVGAAFAAGDVPGEARDAACWAALRALARHGLLLVPPTDSDDVGDDAEAAGRLGRRVATVAGWVRHARGHAHDHAHDHGHSHPH